MRTCRGFSGLNNSVEVEQFGIVVYFLCNCIEKVLMKNQAILTLMADKEEVLKLVPEKLSARGCDFICNDQQVDVFRDEDGALGCNVEFQIRLGLFPHSGPIPQYVKAMGEIVSVRRCAQSRYRVSLNFHQVSQDGYRLIAEHLSDAVINLDQEHSQSA